jgi:phage terminase large subunit
MYSLTTATKKIKKLDKRVKVVAGGTSASKTISILLILIDLSQRDTVPKLTSVVSESIPHLKRGAMRDFLDIMKAHGYYKDELWNRTDSIYTFETGSQIEFFGADQPDKLRGARRDRLFINECNNVTHTAYNELEVRTREDVWLDFNPTNEFWFYTDILPNEDMDVDFITLTYKDNEALDENTIKAIESRKNNKAWWQVYGLGLLGEHENRVYKDWEIIDDIPYMARLIRRGLDFGYSNDPAALVDVYSYNGGYILDEQLYRKGMSNRQLAEFVNMLKEPHTIIVADSSEPKSIDEIRSFGVAMIPAVKGQGSINQGIQLVQDFKIQVTKRSTNLIKEYRNYLWMTDKEGKSLNVPEGGYDHILDAMRYAITSLKRNTNTKVYKPK